MLYDVIIDDEALDFMKILASISVRFSSDHKYCKAEHLYSSTNHRSAPQYFQTNYRQHNLGMLLQPKEVIYALLIQMYNIAVPPGSFQLRYSHFPVTPAHPQQHPVFFRGCAMRTTISWQVFVHSCTRETLGL